MNDLLHKILKFVDHERGKLVGLVLAVVIVLGAYGCEMKLDSPFSGNKVTQQQFEVEVKTASAKLEAQVSLLNIEIEELHANAEITNEEFAKWQELKEKGFEILGGVVTSATTGGGVNIPQIAASLLALAGIGSAAGGWYDSNRKNKVIEKVKNGKGSE